MEPPVGIEPTTHCLQNSCSTAELRWPIAGQTKFPDRDQLDDGNSD